MMNYLDRADRYPVGATTDEADPEDLDALVLPGGVANPNPLRLEFVTALFEAGRPTAVICHGPWTLVKAGLVDGRTLTSWPSLQIDIRNAGGNWVDQEVVVCASGPNAFVTSRKPYDLPAFYNTLIEEFAKAGNVATR